MLQGALQTKEFLIANITDPKTEKLLNEQEILTVFRYTV